jgi:mono/diheme cytochrome c family protein
MRKLAITLLVAVLSALLLAACGGGDEPTPTPQPQPTAIATMAAAAPVAASNGAAAAPAEASNAVAAAAPAGNAAEGQKIYGQICIACHGPDAKGVKGLGKDLTASEFVAGLDDTGLVEFIKKGRDPSDPLNTTGIAMPPKAGNPALTDQQLFDIVAFVRTVHGK